MRPRKKGVAALPSTCSDCMDPANNQKYAWCMDDKTCIERPTIGNSDPGSGRPEFLATRCGSGTGSWVFGLGNQHQPTTTKMHAYETCSNADQLSEASRKCMKHASCGACLGDESAEYRCGWCESLGCFPVRLKEPHSPATAAANDEAIAPSDVFPIFGKPSEEFKRDIYPKCKPQDWRFPNGADKFFRWEMKEMHGKRTTKRLRNAPAAKAAVQALALPSVPHDEVDYPPEVIAQYTSNKLQNCSDVANHNHCDRPEAKKACAKSCGLRTQQAVGGEEGLRAHNHVPMAEHMVSAAKHSHSTHDHSPNPYVEVVEKYIKYTWHKSPRVEIWSHNDKVEWSQISTCQAPSTTEITQKTNVEPLEVPAFLLRPRQNGDNQGECMYAAPALTASSAHAAKAVCALTVSRCHLDTRT